MPKLAVAGVDLQSTPLNEGFSILVFLLKITYLSNNAVVKVWVEIEFMQTQKRIIDPQLRGADNYKKGRHTGLPLQDRRSQFI